MTTTDHSQATLESEHIRTVPDVSRGARRVSFDPDDFPKPTGREEEWRFTPLERLGKTLDEVPVEHTPTWTLEALPAGVSVKQITPDKARAISVRAATDRAGAVASRQALRGIHMSVAPGVVVPRPVDVGILFSEDRYRTHFVMEVGEGAEVVMIVRYSGAAEVSEYISIDLARRARLTLVLIDECTSEAVHLVDLVARLGEGASMRGSLVTLGIGVARRNSTILMAGEGSEVDLNGLYFANDGQHIENRVFIDHEAPHCRSRVTFKGALAGETARTVWIGDVLIRAQAQGTDTYELNRNLLLTGGARADSVPNLEIETGEIAGAGHASATGRFDDEQLFYLRSRGIPEAEARAMVVRGFFHDLIGQIGVPALEKDLMRSIERKLGTEGE